jgi:hypothetical protein
MKKALYALLVIVILGGVTFGLSQGNMLKGSFGDASQTVGEDGEDSGSSGGTLDLEGTEGTWDPGGRDLPGGAWEPGGTIPTGGTTSCDSEYWLWASVMAEDDQHLIDIRSGKFTVTTTSGSDVTDDFDFENETDGTYSTYRFDYNGSGSPNSSYYVEVDPSGYQAGEMEISINDSCVDVYTGGSLTVDYNHKVTVKDHEGNKVLDDDAIVATGNTFSTECEYWDEEEVYLCATPDTSTEQYYVRVNGYVAKEGYFSGAAKASPSTSKFGLASLLAAADTGTTGRATDYEIPVGTSDAVDYTYGSGVSGDSKTVTMNEFAWTISVYDEASLEPISGAEPYIYVGFEFPCEEYEDGLYWCLYTDYAGSAYPEYNVTASGYDDASGDFEETRSDYTDPGVLQGVAMTATDTTDPATYCDASDAFTISSVDLPLASDATELGDITIDVELTATNSAFADDLYVGVSDGSGTLSNATSSGTLISSAASGLLTDVSYTYSGGAVGDTLYAFTMFCVSDEFEITQTSDEASYCDTLDIDSSALPLESDDTTFADFTLGLELLASSEDYEDTLTISIEGDGTIDGATSVTVDADEKSTYGDYTISGYSVGDTITASVAGGYCDDHTLEVTQDDADTEYGLACSAVDITPNSYEIELTDSSSTLHTFEIEWTVAEQAIALREAPEWIKKSFALKNANNPLVFLAEETSYDPITLTIETTGNGDFYLEGLSTSYTEIEIEIDAAETDDLTFYYTGADGGDSIYVTASDSSCSDSVTLTEEEEEEDDDIDFDDIIDGCEEYPFDDVDDDDDLAPYIYCLADAGAVQGYGDGRYGPSNDITNAELIKVVVAMTGEPLESSSAGTDFIDISGHWAERYIKTAEALGIARPIENPNFYPDSAADRTFLALMLVRAAEQTLWDWDANDIPFTDVRSIDPEAYAVIILHEAEGDVPGVGEEVIVSGYSDGTFRGDNSIRRDEAAAMLIRAFYAWFL